MRIEIESTDLIVEFGGTPVRFWKGINLADGSEIFAYVAAIQVEEITLSAMEANCTMLPLNVEVIEGPPPNQ